MEYKPTGVRLRRIAALPDLARWLGLDLRWKRRGEEVVRPTRKRWSWGLSSVGVVVVLALGTALALPRLKDWFPRERSPLEGLQTTKVRRADMSVTLTTGGKVESSEQTKIDCELQRLDMSVKGQAMVGGGASTMIFVVPDGTLVKKGEVLCEFDSSEYVEMLRQQKMTVKRSKADYLQAQLDLDVARMAVKEFKEGTMVEALKELGGLVALAEASLRRATDRLTWTRKMLGKGYVPASQLATEEFNEKKAALQLKKGRMDLDVFGRFTAPRILKTLEGQVFGFESTLNYQDRRLKRHAERQEMLASQVENCTVRAPHDGLVIYYYNSEKQIKIEEGMVVRQGQNLFYLPDLNQMKAMAMVHESVAGDVRPGMQARVRIEALPGQVIEGRVLSIAQLPTQNFFNELRYFYTEVSLETIPEGLMPGMTAEVEIVTDRRGDVLAIPIEAMALEEGREVCYVAHEDRIERRPIKVGQSTSGLLEVVEGLDEGEQIVLNPAQFDTELESLSPFTPEGDKHGSSDVHAE